MPLFVSKRLRFETIFNSFTSIFCNVLAPLAYVRRLFSPQEARMIFSWCVIFLPSCERFLLYFLFVRISIKSRKHKSFLRHDIHRCHRTLVLGIDRALVLDSTSNERVDVKRAKPLRKLLIKTPKLIRFRDR